MFIFQSIIRKRELLRYKKLKIIYVLNRIENFVAKHLNFRTRETFFFPFFEQKHVDYFNKSV